MKRTIKIALLLCLLALTSIANAQIKVTGTVTNEVNEPIEFANVVLLNNAKSRIITGCITDKKGYFEIETNKNEELSLQISYIGFTDYYKNITSSVDLGKIILKSNNKLEEVVITSKKKIFEKKIDRLVFNVGQSVMATGGDALDALKVTPRLRVGNDQISMVGKDNLGVMINGRKIQLSGEDLINFLETIPSDNIKTIEVITNPPAKYEAEGNSGLINIIYKNAKKNNWSSTARSSLELNSYTIWNFGSNFYLKNNGWTFFIDVNKTDGSYKAIEKPQYIYPDGTFWNQQSERRDYIVPLSTHINVSYDFSKKINIGIGYLASFDNPDIKDETNAIIYSNKNEQHINSIIRSKGFNKRNIKNHDLNFYSTIKLDTTGKKINFDIDFLKYSQQNDRDFSSLTEENSPTSPTFSSSNDLSNQNITIYSSKIDCELPYKWGNINFGSKVSFTKNDSGTTFYDTTSGIPILDTNQTDNFLYNENIYAIYLSYQKKINEKWRVKFGSRFEYTQTKGVSKSMNLHNENAYGNYFPTIYLLYKPNDKNTFSVNYGRRINRASYRDFNPFRWYSTANSYSVGNPFLNPSISDNFEFSYYPKMGLNTEITISKLTNGFGQVTFFEDNPRTQIFKKINYYKSIEYGIEESYTFNKLKRFSSYLEANFYLNKSKSKIPQYDKEFYGHSVNLYTINRYFFNSNKTFSASLIYWYSFPSKDGFSNISEAMNLDFGVKWKNKNKKLSISLAFNDILKSSGYTFKKKIYDITSINYNYYDNRYIKFSILYKIGNKILKHKDKENSNLDEKNRL